jgi:hypothetical protein
MNRPNEEELFYAVEEGTLDDSRLLEVVARVHLLSVAFAAYEATVVARTHGAGLFFGSRSTRWRPLRRPLVLGV